jgi:hypothetical protein
MHPFPEVRRHVSAIGDEPRVDGRRLLQRPAIHQQSRAHHRIVLPRARRERASQREAVAVGERDREGARALRAFVRVSTRLSARSDIWKGSPAAVSRITNGNYVAWMQQLADASDRLRAF